MSNIMQQQKLSEERSQEIESIQAKILDRNKELSNIQSNIEKNSYEPLEITFKE